MKGKTSWRVDLRRELRELLIGAHWKRESKPLGELLTVYVCVVPCMPVVVTRLAYHPTEAGA